MSRATIRQVGLAVFFACFAVGCGETPEAIDTGDGGLTASDREDYTTEFDGKLNGFGSRLDALNEQVEQLPEDQREKWRETAQELDEFLRKAKSQLSEFTDATGEKWEEQKQQLEKTISDLESSFSNAESNFDFPNLPAPQ